jgi:hypothetical protein
MSVLVDRRGFGLKEIGCIWPLQGKGLATGLKTRLPGFVSSARAAQDARSNLPPRGVLQGEILGDRAVQ